MRERTEADAKRRAAELARFPANVDALRNASAVDACAPLSVALTLQPVFAVEAAAAAADGAVEYDALCSICTRKKIVFLRVQLEIAAMFPFLSEYPRPPPQPPIVSRSLCFTL
jgi:hypothetical protein